MSRHTFPGHAGALVALGYDRPLKTFFVQVLKENPRKGGDDKIIEWQGTSPGELTTAAAVIAIASQYADLPADIGATLETDRLRTLGTFDGHAQRAARPFLDES